MGYAVRGWLRDTAGGLPATYWYLWSGLLINRIGGFAVLFLSLYLTAQRGAGVALAGLVVGTYGIGGVIGTLAGGVLTDRWGRRRTLLWSHLACAAVLAVLAAASDLALIAVLCALLGLAQSMPGPAFVAAIIDIVPAARRSRAFNLQFWAFNLGTAGASLLAGLLAGWSYAGLFLIDGGSALIAALLIAWKVPETLGRRTAPASGRRGLGTVLTDRIFLAFAGLTLLQALIYTQTSTIVPLAMRADGLGPAAYGLVVALSGALIVVGQLFVPRLIDHHRKHRILAAAQIATAFGFAVLIVADRLPAYLAAAAIWTVGSMLAAPPNAEINSELAPPALRGRYQAVFYLTFPAASFLAPTLGGAGLQYLGSAHWLIVAAVGLVAAALHLAAGPSRERRVAAIRTETASTAPESPPTRPLTPALRPPPHGRSHQHPNLRHAARPRQRLRPPPARPLTPAPRAPPAATHRAPASHPAPTPTDAAVHAQRCPPSTHSADKITVKRDLAATGGLGSGWSGSQAQEQSLGNRAEGCKSAEVVSARVGTRRRGRATESRAEPEVARRVARPRESRKPAGEATHDHARPATPARRAESRPRNERRARRHT